MAVLFITCGVPGAGKTTVAKRLEREHHALRLTPDEWLRELFPQEKTGVGAAIRAAIEELHWSTALRALEIGCNVVLDYGLWGRSERDRFRSEARALGAQVVLCFLDPPREELIRRLAARNADLPAGTFHIAEQKLEDALATLQRPTPEELALFDQLPPDASIEPPTLHPRHEADDVRERRTAEAIDRLVVVGNDDEVVRRSNQPLKKD